MKNFKHLYINGCSFTRGHQLQNNKTWPYLLSKKLNVPLTNESENGNSFESIIYHTLKTLSEMNKIEDTLVVIGLTWPSRFMVRENHNTHNITPGTTRYLERIYRDEEVTTAGYMIIKKYVEYFEARVKYDNEIKHNLKFKMIEDLVLLQSFFKVNNINYKFIDFEMIEGEPRLPIYKKIDFDNIITFGDEYKVNGKYLPIYVDNTSHPTDVFCEKISERIYEKLIH